MVGRGRPSRLGSLFGRSEAGRVREPELDMQRGTVQPARRMAVLYAAWRWLAPGRAGPAAPMRSVDRELEESWPSYHR